MFNLNSDMMTLSIIVILLLIVLVGLINYQGIYSILFCHLINLLVIFMLIYVY